MTEGGGGGGAPRLYSRGPMRGWTAIAANLERWGREGRLVVDDPQVAALHLKGLVEAGLVEPRLYGAAAAVSREQAARQGVRIFLAGYRPPIG